MATPSRGHLAFGLALMAVGGVLLAERTGFWPYVEFGMLWPVILIVIGVVYLFVPRPDEGRSGAIWLIVIGGLFLMHTQHVMSLRDSWPLLIVAAGLSVVINSLESTGSRSAGEER